MEAPQEVGGRPDEAGDQPVLIKREKASYLLPSSMSVGVEPAISSRASASNEQSTLSSGVGEFVGLAARHASFGSSGSFSTRATSDKPHVPLTPMRNGEPSLEFCSLPGTEPTLVSPMVSRRQLKKVIAAGSTATGAVPRAARRSNAETRTHRLQYRPFLQQQQQQRQQVQQREPSRPIVLMVAVCCRVELLPGFSDTKDTLEALSAKADAVPVHWTVETPIGGDVWFATHTIASSSSSSSIGIDTRARRSKNEINCNDNGTNNGGGDDSDGNDASTGSSSDTDTANAEGVAAAVRLASMITGRPPAGVKVFVGVHAAYVAAGVAEAARATCHAAEAMADVAPSGSVQISEQGLEFLPVNVAGAFRPCRDAVETQDAEQPLTAYMGAGSIIADILATDVSSESSFDLTE